MGRVEESEDLMEMLILVALLCPGYLKLTKEEKGFAITCQPLWWVLLQKVVGSEKKSSVTCE
jgi:hypothetical protein